MGLYGLNASEPVGESKGLREGYRFGLYSYCGFVNTSGHGSCSNETIARKYNPYNAIKADMGTNYSSLTDSILETYQEGHTGFQASSTLGNYTTAAYYLILLATICVGLAFILCVPLLFSSTPMH
jgi:hypothetical protein